MPQSVKRFVLKNKKIRQMLFLVAASAMAPLLTACGGPTYGTGQTSSQQLVDDFSNIAQWNSLGSNAHVDTRPRPELIKPNSADLAKPLPVPQEAIAASNNPKWPESPEQRRARLRQEATDNRDNPHYVSPIKRDSTAENDDYPYSGVNRVKRREARMPSPREAEEQAKAYREARQAQRTPSNTGGRKYLSDPPSEYFTPSPDAPQGDLGVSEEEKQADKNNERTSLFGK